MSSPPSAPPLFTLPSGSLFDPDDSPYRIGITAPRFIPSEQDIHDMLHLVAYDISTVDSAGQKRLRLAAKVCEDFGVRIEKSVFECDLSANTFAEFWGMLSGIIDPDTDSLIAYRICRTCVKDTLTAGVIDRPRQALYYMP
jgi:CRISPR-associated protein Cas2